MAKIQIEFPKRSVGDRMIYLRFQLGVRDSSDIMSYYTVGKALDYNLGVVDRCARGYLTPGLFTKERVFLRGM